MLEVKSNGNGLWSVYDGSTRLEGEVATKEQAEALLKLYSNGSLTAKLLQEPALAPVHTGDSCQCLDCLAFKTKEAIRVLTL